MSMFSSTIPQSELAARYCTVRAATDALASRLTPEDQMVQSMSDASPTKWHLAHTTWFFETFILAPHARRYRPFNDNFKYLFNSYYKQLDGHPLRSIRGTFSRPSLDDISAYRAHVDAAMDSLLNEQSAAVDNEVAELLQLGLNHEQQHQELIVTDIKHAFWTNPLRPAYIAATPGSTERASEMEWIEFAGGVKQVGHSGEGFSFDNETPRHGVLLSPFRLASRLVTNAEYLEFVEDAGYRRPELWLSDGWDHIAAHGWQSPMYWEKANDNWQVFTTNGMQHLNPEEPVCHLSYYEAEAYARWRGLRLPTEIEWEVAAAELPIRGNLAESNRFHPATGKGAGLSQMFGDVWEWTSSSYSGYPGYRQSAGALGEYNGKFMCNQFVLRGGSCATPESHIRATYRNFFSPHSRWQFMGVRLADDRA
ncbi:MAG TPA: ergothioneine biosynthesis protein EgtB [Terriglobales bacterium]|nr:ergothioneine biosynthesis protein EgtB [Terriglobales bacterium]